MIELKVKGLLEATPLEQYKIGNRTVHVKRDDLMGDGNYLPPWGKIGAIYRLVSKYVDRSRPLTHLSVDGSWSGWTLAAFCEQLGIEFYYSYPDSKKFNRDILEHVKKLYPNVKFNPLRPNMMQIMYNTLKRDAKERGWQMLPYAFNHEFYKEYMGNRVYRVNAEHGPFDNLIVSSGSGVSIAGLARGFFSEELDSFFNPDIKKKIYSTCVSTENSVNLTLRKNGLQNFPIFVNKSPFDFSDRMEDQPPAPFPCNQFWDVKQWHWLVENIDKIEGSILFWNLGGLYNF